MHTYMRMRGKDFVRRLMGRHKKGTTVGKRQEMAAVSNPKLRIAASKKIEKDGEKESSETEEDERAEPAIMRDIIDDLSNLEI